MRFLSRAARWLSELRETTDRAFMASTLSQVGERGLAREIMAGPIPEAVRGRAVPSHREYDRGSAGRCLLATGRGG